MNELIRYFLLAYAISWFLWAPYYLSPMFGYDLTSAPLFHLLGSFGPLLASLVLTYTSKGTLGIRSLLSSMMNWRVGALYFALATLGPFFILFISMLTSHFVNGVAWSLVGLGTSKELKDLPIIAFILINIFIFGYGEETGWRGFALPRIQQKFNALTSSILLAFCWALWHWPLFFYKLSGYYSMDIPSAIGWIFSMLIGSVLMTYLFNSTNGSILACAVFHGTMDIAFVSDFADKNLVNYNGMLITIAGVLVLLIAKPSRLSRKKKVTIVSDEGAGG